MLIAKNLHQVYPGAPRPALSQLSFALEEGKILTVTGASGSGKSSLLRILAGIENPESGSLFWKDEALLPSERLVGGHPAFQLLEQSPKLPPNLSAEATIQKELRAYSKIYQEERLHKLLHFFGIENPTRLPRELSGGEQQRVGLARVMARVPEVLLLDEPFAHLDYLNKVKLREMILKLRDTLGLTIIFVTHHIRESFGLADQLLALEKGAVIQFDTPEAIYNNPKTPNIARLFGATNILPLRLLGEDFTNFSPDTLAYVPPEFIRLSSKGGKSARIKSLLYMGGRTQVCATLKDNTELYFFTSHAKLQVGDVIKVVTSFERLHIFES
ncbi:MAG: ABC transporter ATP-binding protein [Bacteroidota bacterium]